MIIILQACASQVGARPEYEADIHPSENAVLISKIYSRAFLPVDSGKKRQRYIGGEIILGRDNCQEGGVKYILGKKILLNALDVTWLPVDIYTFALSDEAREVNYQYWHIEEDNEHNYEYMPEYDVLSLPAGKYEFCKFKQFKRGKSPVSKSFKPKKSFSFTLAEGDIIYIGDILLAGSNAEILYKPVEVQAYIDRRYSELAYGMRYKALVLK